MQNGHKHNKLSFIQTGTYVGDGQGNAANWSAYQQIDLSFQPKKVEVYEFTSTADEIHVALDNFPSDYDVGFWNGAADTDTNHTKILYRLRVGTNCFQVNDAGVDANPNKNGVTYYYIAFGVVEYE